MGVWAWRTPGCAEMMGYNTVYACTRYQVQAVALMLRGTMWEVASGCEHEVGEGRVRRDGSWVGVGAKSGVHVCNPMPAGETVVAMHPDRRGASAISGSVAVRAPAGLPVMHATSPVRLPPEHRPGCP